MQGEGAGSLLIMDQSLAQEPTHAVALCAHLPADAPGCLARLTFVPHERKVAVINAGATASIDRATAAMIHLIVHIGDRTTFAAHGQWFSSSESWHEVPIQTRAARSRHSLGE